ncbi:hypothetical protein PYCC9005_004931 [Savitreella phatthalungensis]
MRSIKSLFSILLCGGVMAAEYDGTSYNEGQCDCELGDGWTSSFSGSRFLRLGYQRYKHHVRFPGGGGDKVLLAEIEHEDHGSFVFGIPFSGTIGNSIHYYWTDCMWRLIGGDAWHDCQGWEEAE